MLQATVSLLLCAIFSLAAVHKVRHWDAAMSTLVGLGASRRAAPSLGGGIVAAEALTPLLLVPPSTRSFGIAYGIAMLCGFNAVILLAKHRGSSVPCNCFRSATTPMGWTQFSRNSILIFGAGTSLVGGLGQASVAGPAALALCAAFASVFLLCFFFFDDLVELIVLQPSLPSGRVP